MENRKVGEVVDQNGKGESTLFRKELALKETTNVQQNLKTNQTVGFDIQQLAMKVDRVRRKCRLNDENGHQFTLLLKGHIHKSQKKGHDGADVLKNLNKIREKSKQTRNSAAFDRYPSSALRPTHWELGNAQDLSVKLQRIIEKARSDTSHAIQKLDPTQLSNGQFLGIVKQVQALSKSLKVLEIVQASDDKDVKYKIAVVCLWNEWVELRKDDIILFEDLDGLNESNVMQWSFKWKKMVSS